MQVRLDRVHPVVLQRISPNLVAEPDPAPFLMQINDHAAIRRHDSLERLLQLLAAVASRRREHVAGQALRMEPHQGRTSAAYLTLDKSQMLAAVDDVAEDYGIQHTAFDRKRLLGNALDQDFIRQAMRDELLDVDDWQRMLCRELAQLLEPRRLAVLPQYRAQSGDVAHPRRTHQVDCPLGAANPHHHASTAPSAAGYGRA